MAEIELACALADAAFNEFRETTPVQRARFLEAVADEVAALGDALIDRAMQESGLPQARLVGELGRTAGQLRLFAGVLRDGSWLDVRIDRAQPDRSPLPRSDLRLRRIAMGPVVVFGASNFPLAFSVAGGDTASALAAGCPVIVKAHSAHLGTSEMVAGAIDRARRAAGLPSGVFSMLVGADNALGAALVADPRIKAVGFTGSRRGGLALMEIAAKRPEPIPVYAEMSSINPVLLFEHALTARGEAIAAAFAQSLTLGAGQFCTNPGLLIAIDSPALDRFVDVATVALASTTAATMLTPDIHAAYGAGIEARRSRAAALGCGAAPTGTYEAHAHLFATDAATFLADHMLHEELFGPAALLVRCADAAAMAAVVEALEGQLTAALHIDEGDYPAARSLLPTLERKAGRLLVNGFGTGVEVSHAMVHGGPFPATSDSRTTSVGSLALERFLRPICYQDLPEALLPAALQESNPLGVPRRIEGVMEGR